MCRDHLEDLRVVLGAIDAIGIDGQGVDTLGALEGLEQSQQVFNIAPAETSIP